MIEIHLKTGLRGEVLTLGSVLTHFASLSSGSRELNTPLLFILLLAWI